ncbi:MAG: hypothetical protein JSS82_07380 [Bacteroidetes bacterium]|nr:hypothetical protein [Bacteroidota bacterium]
MDKLLKKQWPVVSMEEAYTAIKMLDINEFDPEYMTSTVQDFAVYYVVFSVHAILKGDKAPFPPRGLEPHWSAPFATHGRFGCRATSVRRLAATSETDFFLNPDLISQGKSHVVYMNVDKKTVTSAHQTLPFFLPYVEYGAWCFAVGIKEQLPVEVDMTMIRWDSFRYTCSPSEHSINKKAFVSSILNMILMKNAGNESIRAKLNINGCREFYKKYCRAIEVSEKSYATVRTVADLSKALKTAGLMELVPNLEYQLDRAVNSSWANLLMPFASINNTFKLTHEISGGALRLEGRAFSIAAALNYHISTSEPLLPVSKIPKMMLFNLLLFVPEVFLDSALWMLMLHQLSPNVQRKLHTIPAVDRSVLKTDPVRLSYDICAVSDELKQYRSDFRNSFFGFVGHWETSIVLNLGRYLSHSQYSAEYRKTTCAATRNSIAYMVPNISKTSWPALAEQTCIEFEEPDKLMIARVLTQEFISSADDFQPVSGKQTTMTNREGMQYSNYDLKKCISVSRCFLVEEFIDALLEYETSVVECATTHTLLDPANLSFLGNNDCVFVCPTVSHQMLLSAAWHPIAVYTMEQVLEDDRIRTIDARSPLVFLYAHLFSLQQCFSVLKSMMPKPSVLSKRDADGMEITQTRRCVFYGLRTFSFYSDGTFINVMNQLPSLAACGVLQNVQWHGSFSSAIDMALVMMQLNTEPHTNDAYSMASLLDNQSSTTISVINSPDEDISFDSLLNFDAIFPSFLTVAESASVKRIFDSFNDIYVVSTKYGTVMRLSSVPGECSGGKTPICFCNCKTSGIFGPALSMMKSSKLYCSQFVPDNLSSRMKKIKCNKCSVGSSSSHTGSDMVVDNMVYDAEDMQLQLQFHPKYPSRYIPQEYRGVPVPRSLIITGKFLPFDQLIAALDMSISNVTVLSLAKAVKVTRIPAKNQSEKWLADIASEYIKRKDEKSGFSSSCDRDVKFPKME